MDAMVAAKKGSLVRDLLIFQMKLVLDGIKGVFLIQLSIGAALFDLVFGRPGRPLLFYGVLRLSERFDLWMNLYGAARHAEESSDGLFGASRAGDDTMLGKLEELVNGTEEEQAEARRARSPAPAL
jgi:hypothetical protein